MKFIHISDLHLGKRLHNYDIMEEQKDALQQVLDTAIERQVDAVVIAGDVYDTTQPPAEAYKLLDWFLTRLAEARIEVFMIAGNHDSADRLSFGNHLLELAGVHIVGSWPGQDVVLERKDAWGTVAFHLVPYLRFRNMKHLDESIASESDAFAYVKAQMDLKPDQRHVLVAHQFFSNSKEHEQIISGLELVNAEVLEGFDYCALGHLHRAQKVGADTNRFSGTLSKFSKNDAHQQKSFVLVQMEPEVTIEQIPITPLRDVVEIKGTLEELTRPSFVKTQNTDHYFCAVLEDEQEVYGAMDALRRCYPRMLTLDWTAQKQLENPTQQAALQLDGMHLIDTFFTLRTGKEMSDWQRDLMETLWKEVQDATDSSDDERL